MKDRVFRVWVNDTLSDERLMETGVPQGRVQGPILFIFYSVELLFVLERLGVFYHCYAYDIQICLTFEGFTEAENKLGVFFNEVDKWMRSRRHNINSDKTERILVKANNSTRRKVDIRSVMLGDKSVLYSISVRNLGFLFHSQLHLDEQINNVKRKVIVVSIKSTRIAK